MSNHIDVYIGKRLKSRRSILGISQEELGEYVGITFQQIQKYERGSNKISASRLYEFSIILNVDISFFFSEFNSDDKCNYFKTNKIFTDDTDSKLFFSFLRAYFSITDHEIRKKILELVKAIVNFTNITDNKHKRRRSNVTAR